jgi:putative membrane protein
MEAEKLGLESCIVINAHNSINGFIDTKAVLEALERVAVECLKKAISTSSASFKVGAATVMPKEFSLRDGMGPGGITVVVVEVRGQKTAYVVIDGNNMVSGLREKFLDGLKSLGFVEGEVFTTDTHAVNAVTFNERGYHPVGEVMNHEKLMGYIVEAARKALSSMEPAKFGCREVLIPRVKVIGQKPLEQLCVLTDKVIQTAKRMVVPLFGVAFLVLMLVLLHI